jgi:dihydroflavonol-4-reductase
LIRPAVEGTRAVFNAALKHKVKKIVITSSIAAIMSGIVGKNNFDEKDWTNLPSAPVYD